MTEHEETRVLANKILDRVSADQDDDLAMLSRQLLRADERVVLLEDALRCQIKYCSNGQIHTTAKAVIGETEQASSL